MRNKKQNPVVERSAFCQDTREMEDRKMHVAAGICFRKDKILIARRGSEKNAPLLWEFPGGKVEPGETPRKALKRELQEELDLDLEPAEKIGESRIIYRGTTIRMECFAVPVPSASSPAPLEHEELAWTVPEEWQSYDWAPSDIPLIEDPRFIRSAKDLLLPNRIGGMIKRAYASALGTLFDHKATGFFRKKKVR
jgi:8-oxo-dGTP diphosphatase